MWVVRCKGVVIYMRFFDYIDTIEKPTIDNIRVIYKAVNEKYDDLIDMALEPNSKNYKKWVQNMECLKKSENMMIDCIGKKQITDTEWLELMYNIYRYQVIIKYQKDENLFKTLQYLDNMYASNRNINLDIDINPLKI